MIRLKEIGLYDGSTPEALQRQLKQLEKNVADAVKRLDGAFLPVLTPTKLQSDDCVSVLGDMVMTDSSSGSLTVTAPIATEQNAGRCFGVVRTSSLNSVQVAAASGLVSSVASDNLPTTKRLYLFFSDGEGWWRLP